MTDDPNDTMRIFFLQTVEAVVEPVEKMIHPATAVFFLYFIVVIIRALIRDWKKYFTPEAGAVGVALITLFIHSYFTAGVLRRPNASFYFSVCLAAAYYLVKINGEGHSVERIQN